MLDQSLLGMSFLSTLDFLQMQTDELRLRIDSNEEGVHEPALLQSVSMVTAATLFTVNVYAGESVFHGRWRQVDSNAGQCKTCLIAIVRHGEMLTVTANNGWSAVIRADRRGQALEAKERANGKTRHSPFIAMPLSIWPSPAAANNSMC